MEDYRALVRWYAEHRTPRVATAFVDAIVAAVGEISVEDAVLALTALEHEKVKTEILFSLRFEQSGGRALSAGRESAL